MAINSLRYWLVAHLHGGHTIYITTSTMYTSTINCHAQPPLITINTPLRQMQKATHTQNTIQPYNSRLRLELLHHSYRLHISRDTQTYINNWIHLSKLWMIKKSRISRSHLQSIPILPVTDWWHRTPYGLFENQTLIANSNKNLNRKF